jgi:hypothetical protein
MRLVARTGGFGEILFILVPFLANRTGSQTADPLSARTMGGHSYPSRATC